MSTPVYTDTAFRLQFPEFADTDAYPATSLSQWWTMGTSYLATNQPGWAWSAAQQQLANDLMGAHLAKSFSLITGGTVPGVTQSASEGSVSVSMVPPPANSAFGYWLATTAYGQQLRALLMVMAGPGLYVGGSPERSGFRKAGGVF